MQDEIREANTTPAPWWPVLVAGVAVLGILVGLVIWQTTANDDPEFVTEKPMLVLDDGLAEVRLAVADDFALDTDGSMTPELLELLNDLRAEPLVEDATYLRPQEIRGIAPDAPTITLESQIVVTFDGAADDGHPQDLAARYLDRDGVTGADIDLE